MSSKISIFVGNIAYGALEAEVRELFSQYGTVLDVHFCMDWQKGKFRGFGFITMPESEAKEAIKNLNGYKFLDREIKVSIAQSKSSSHSE